MLTHNPFAELSASISPAVMTAYVVLMAVLVVAGTLFDVIHKGSARYFFVAWRTATSKGSKRVGGGELVSLAIRTLCVEVLTSAEFCTARRRIAHLLTMYGFLAYVVTSAIMVIGYPTADTPAPAVVPALWHIGALIGCIRQVWPAGLSGANRQPARSLGDTSAQGDPVRPTEGSRRSPRGQAGRAPPHGGCQPLYPVGGGAQASRATMRIPVSGLENGALLSMLAGVTGPLGEKEQTSVRDPIRPVVNERISCGHRAGRRLRLRNPCRTCLDKLDVAECKYPTTLQLSRVWQPFEF